MVETQLVPKLALLVRGPQRSRLEAPRYLEPSELERWADLAVAGDLDALWSAARDLEEHRGWADTSLLLDVITPVARLVGADWEEDRRTWLDVTLAVSTLQRLLCVLGRERRCTPEHRGAVVLFAAPGEQHTLSIHVLGEVLRRLGWSAHVEPGLSLDEVVEIVAREPIALVGMTVSSQDRMTWSRQDVAQVIEASLDPDLVFMIGGAIDVSEYAHDLRATACSDLRSVVALLELAERARRDV
jgi:methanogenic corrinoid protein MtbC1